MAAKFFTGLPLDGPDPECVRGHGEIALETVAAGGAAEARRWIIPTHATRPWRRSGARVDQPPPAAERACDESPLAGPRRRRARQLNVRDPLRCWLADLAWPDVAERAAAGAMLAVPLGATEQHGPHLPLSTDTDIAVALSPPAGRRAAGRADRAGGGLRVQRRARRFRRHAVDRPDRRRALVLELGRSATRDVPARAVSCPPTAATPGRSPVRSNSLRSRSRDVTFFSGPRPGTATRTPADRDRPPARPAPGTWCRPLRCRGRQRRSDPRVLPQLVAGGGCAVSPNGVLGDPTGATAAEGEQLLTQLTDGLEAKSGPGSAGGAGEAGRDDDVVGGQVLDRGVAQPSTAESMPPRRMSSTFSTPAWPLAARPHR